MSVTINLPEWALWLFVVLVTINVALEVTVLWLKFKIKRLETKHEQG